MFDSAFSEYAFCDIGSELVVVVDTNVAVFASGTARKEGNRIITMPGGWKDYKKWINEEFAAMSIADINTKFGGEFSYWTS